MIPPDDQALHDLLAKLFKADPWHGIAPGPDAPEVVHAYIEIVPTDAVNTNSTSFPDTSASTGRSAFPACARRPTDSFRRPFVARQSRRSVNHGRT